MISSVFSPSLRFFSSSLVGYRSNPSEARRTHRMDCFFAMLIAMALSGCNLLRKVTAETSSDKQSSSVEEQAKLSANRFAQTNQHFLEWRLDSMSSNNVVMIWPKGKFKFSIENGFEGEAEQIMLKSSLVGSGAHLTVKDSLVHEKEQLSAELQHKSTDQLKAKTSVRSERPSFWILVVIVVAIAIGILLYKYSPKLL